MNAVVSLTDIGNAKSSYQQIAVHMDNKYETAWCYMHPTPRPCFNVDLLTELQAWCDDLRQHGVERGTRYHVIASSTPGIFNLGGDLGLFRGLIQKQDRANLSAYAKACIDAIYSNLSHFDSPITTISLVQGDALGGGFETALSSDVLIAEKGVRMGFPEILFNLFPGMGAFSLLSRKLDAKRAERMILSGKLFASEELYEMGLVDILADPGEGETAVYEYIKRENRARNGFQALRKVRETVQPLPYEELTQILEIWVDTALKLDPRDLRMMERLVSRQQSVGAEAA